MKKILLLFVCFFSFTIQSQSFKAGGILGATLGDGSNISNVVVGVDLYYYFNDNDDIIKVGTSLGLRNFLGEERTGENGRTNRIENRPFMPLSASGRVKLFDFISGGVDVGYALGLSSNVDGGFYYRPVVGVDITDNIEINASYESIADSIDWNNVNVGVLFEF